MVKFLIRVVPGLIVMVEEVKLIMIAIVFVSFVVVG